MLRCVLALVMAIALVATATAQRRFPANTLRGELLLVQPPDAVLNGRSARLAPGARIRDEQNMLQMSGALVQRKMMVHYTVDMMGLMLDIWILTPAELAKRPWPTSQAQANAWMFDADAQTWSRP